MTRRMIGLLTGLTIVSATVFVSVVLTRGDATSSDGAVIVQAQASQPKAVETKWQDLLPPGPAPKDPFHELTPDQRFDIETIAWVRSLNEDQLKIEQNQQSIQDAKTYQEQFKQAGLDVDQLLKDYEIWDREVLRRSQEVNTGLNGKSVRLAGYLLPLNFSEDGNTEFLLVPYVGACIHVPPPPPNQIVYVTLPKKKIVRDLYTAVWIHGRMLTKTASKELFLIDGSSDISVGYHIDATGYEPYIEQPAQ